MKVNENNKLVRVASRFLPAVLFFLWLLFLQFPNLGELGNFAQSYFTSNETKQQMVMQFQRNSNELKAVRPT
jgi:hypothetical protein